MKKQNSNEETLLDIIDVSPSFITKPLGNLYTVYLSGMIEEPSRYTKVFEMIRNAEESDIIKFHINSEGGHLFTAIQFIRAMTETKATIIASAEGMCMSAATMIFLSADTFEISEHCMFMFHNYSGGTFGKGGEMYDQLIKERKWSEKIINKIYKGFLTDEEIKSIMNNRDIWMEGDEVKTRLEKLLNMENGIPEPVKKPRARKPKLIA
jgi:ATP-dependent protease ClpP protease subunit